ncbi:hypothetical protein E2C01_071599 [Portunus trituberculatus]|uniref:Uncharacterized protein n=1 Tax=Portunus trituberculatus TaxID=210409 RepID=A0A5B7I0C1_PORTR|nr:hypothetical protein [Portunus trituberculatus]
MRLKKEEEEEEEEEGRVSRKSSQAYKNYTTPITVTVPPFEGHMESIARFPTCKELESLTRRSLQVIAGHCRSLEFALHEDL